MSERIKEIVLISASPKVEKEEPLSAYLASLEERRFKSDEFHVSNVNVRQCVMKNQTEEAFRTMLATDAMIITFPLYFFCLPGLLMRFLQDYDQYRVRQGNVTKNARVFAVVNCGFPEPEINEDAVRVIKSFSRRIGAEFRFGVLIGGGGMILGAKDAPFMKKVMEQITDAFDLMREDVLGNGETPLGNRYVSVRFPRKLYFFMGNYGWMSMARQNGLQKKDLYLKPYRDRN